MRGNDHILGLLTRNPLRGCSRKQIFSIACLRCVEMTICSGFPHGSPYGFVRANKYFLSPFAIRRGDRVGRPLCAEGPPKRHCQFESKGAQRHLNPSRTHQTKGCTKFAENPHRLRSIYTHNSAGPPKRHCQFESKSAQRHLNPKWNRCGGEPVSQASP